MVRKTKYDVNDGLHIDNPFIGLRSKKFDIK